MSAVGGILHPLREDVDLFPGAALPDGTPVWSLHDIVAHKFFQIGWKELQILRYWHIRDAGQIADAVNHDTTLTVTTEDVEEFARFLTSCSLLQVTGEAGTNVLLQQYKKQSSRGWFSTILHSYLFFRLPLFRPTRFLQATWPFVAWAFSPAFIMVTVLAGLTGIALLFPVWPEFAAYVPNSLTPGGLLRNVVPFTMTSLERHSQLRLEKLITAEIPVGSRKIPSVEIVIVKSAI